MIRSKATWQSAVLVLLAVSSSALAQRQPWRHPNGAVESRVQTCTFPQPMNRIAMDDFQYQQTTVIRWIRWWGVVFDPAQLNKKYYVAFWDNGPAGPCPAPCNPSGVHQAYCVDVTTRYAGLDCQGRRVYRFTATLTPNFVALGGTKYWLQISESDADSANVGVEDFRWSGYRQPINCPAQQRTAAPVVTCAISDDCPVPVATDLSFTLHSVCIAGPIIPPPIAVLPPHVFLADIRPAASPGGPPIAIEAVEPDDNGQFYLDTDVPDGNYVITLSGMGIQQQKRTAAVMNGVAPLSFFDIFTGDLNNNGSIDGNDVPPMVNSLLNAP